MGLMLAFKTFMRALSDPEGAKRFLEPKEPREAESKGDNAHLRMLGFLQQSGRLLDFLKEDIGNYTDAQVGAAARAVHADCSRCVEELVTVRPLRTEAEGSRIQVAKGYDPSQIKLVGKVKGEPPYQGVLVHQGWRAHKLSLPVSLSQSRGEVLAAAEVEVE